MVLSEGQEELKHLEQRLHKDVLHARGCLYCLTPPRETQATQLVYFHDQRIPYLFKCFAEEQPDSPQLHHLQYTLVEICGWGVLIFGLSPGGSPRL